MLSSRTAAADARGGRAIRSPERAGAAGTPRRGAVRPARPRRATSAALAALAVAPLLVLAAAPPPAGAGHDPNFPVSTASYRMPYANATQFTVTADHHNHGGENGNRDRMDMVADAPAPGTVVAAASGTIRAVVDVHGVSNGLGDGRDFRGDTGTTLLDGTPHDDAREHSCRDRNEDANDNEELDPGEDLNGNGTLETRVADSTVVGLCQNYNNYVWIEHPNGEWSKYTHLATGSVSALWSVGDVVQVGDVLGVEADIGAASGPSSCMGPPSTIGCGTHLHHEVAVPDDLGDETPFSDGAFVADTRFPAVDDDDGLGQGYFAGGFIQGTNLVPVVCGIDPPGFYADGSSYLAAPCDNTAPTADAGGPYTVAEGSTEELDGTGSSDPENAILTYSWSPATHLSDSTSATPTYTAVDDTVDVLELGVSDLGGDVTAATALTDEDEATVTVTNVAPSVDAVGDTLAEGGTATVSATSTDPGTADTHTATIDWDDGTPAQAVTLAQLAAGVEHVYGDDGVFGVVVTVTDDDGGVGADVVAVDVGNVDPVVALDVPGVVSFPGGDHAVVQAGGELPASADGTDAGSDDLTFAWSTGQAETVHNDGLGPDPSPSPLGTFPFAASHAVDAGFAAPGAEVLALTLSDDDGGSDGAEAGVVVTGTATTTEGSGWWKHQFSGDGSPHIDADTAAGYLEVVGAVSGVFSEHVAAATAEEAHAVLSPAGGDARARAAAALLEAWLQFASGAVAWDATVPLSGGGSTALLDLMAGAEATILSAGASKAELQAVERDLRRVRHAG